MLAPEVLLAFEAAHPRHTGAKGETIRAELGVTPARYYMLLARAAESMEGIAADPLTARRVRARIALAAAEGIWDQSRS